MSSSMAVSSGLSSTKGKAYYTVTVIFVFLSIVAVGLRILAKQIRKRDFQVHDWLIIAALIFAIAYASDSLVAIYPGSVGLHIEEALELGPENLLLTLKAFFASVFLWTSATCLIKLSILHLYITLFAKPSFQYAAYGGVALVSCFWFSYILAEFLICRPLAFNWDKTLEGQCGNLNTQVIAVAIINMLLDLMIVVLPIPVIFTLQMPLKRKLSLCAILSLGLAICIINIVRIVLTEQTTNSADFTYDSVESGLLSGLEVYIGIIIGCLPTLGPLFFKDKSVYGSSGPAKYVPSTHGTYSAQGKSRMDDTQYDRGFERLRDEDLDRDDVPLRDVTAHGGARATAWADLEDPEPGLYSPKLNKDGVINVKTDMRVFTSQAEPTPDRV